MKKPGKVICIVTAVLLMGSLATAVWAQSNDVEFEYDARGRLVKVTSGSGQEAIFDLDDAGNRLTLETSAAGEPKITMFMVPDIALYSDAALGNLVTLSWTSEGTSGCDLFGTVSGTQSLPVNHEVTLQLAQDETFTLSCYLGGVEDVVTKTISLEPAASAP